MQVNTAKGRKCARQAKRAFAAQTHEGEVAARGKAT